MEVPDIAARADPIQLQHELNALADKHLRSHPVPVQEQLWLRRFLDDMHPSERAVAAGEKLRKCLPTRLFERRGRKVYPRKSNRSLA